VNGVLFNSLKIRLPAELSKAYRSLLRNRSTLKIDEFGAGSRVNRSEYRTVQSMARFSSASLKSVSLLFRISKWYNPDLIIELGTGLGISTAGLAMGASKSTVISMEGSPLKAEFARNLIASLDIGNTEILTGLFDDLLPGLLNRVKGKKVLIFLDGNHRYEPTRKYVDILLKGGAGELMIIMDDIHWSDGMERAWEEIKLKEEVRVSLDLFFHGILILKNDMQKENYSMNL
jgi:predicted O-methyltransferase YrrM